MKAPYIALSVLSLIFTHTASALPLSDGCYRGSVSNGSEIVIKVTKASKAKYSIVESSDLNFGPEPYLNQDFIDDYTVSFSKANRWYVGKQSEVRESFSVFGASSVVLKPLSKHRIRYFRTVKYYVADDKPGSDGVRKDKGTLKLVDEAVCAVFGN